MSPRSLGTQMLPALPMSSWGNLPPPGWELCLHRRLDWTLLLGRLPTRSIWCQLLPAMPVWSWREVPPTDRGLCVSPRTQWRTLQVGSPGVVHRNAHISCDPQLTGRSDWHCSTGDPCGGPGSTVHWLPPLAKGQGARALGGGLQLWATGWLGLCHARCLSELQSLLLQP